MGKITEESKYRGLFVALVTPFNTDLTIDYAAFEKLLLWHQSCGIEGFVICGTTGEFPTVDDFEKIELLKVARNVLGKDRILIIGAGFNSTEKTAQFIRLIKQHGADAALVVLPYYNLPNFRGCYQHFEKLNENEFPLILYHHPKRTSVLLTTDEIKEILKMPNVVAIKEAYGDPSRVKQLKDYPVFCGEDSMLVEFIRKGATGSISTFANIIPREFGEIVQRALLNDFKNADHLFAKYTTLFRAVFSDSNPQGVKLALSLMNKCSAKLRLPLVEPELNTQKKILTELDLLQLVAAPVQ